MIKFSKFINGLTTAINIMRMRLNGFTVGHHPRLCGYLHLNIHKNVNFSVGNNCIIVSGGGRNEIGRNSGTYITLYDNASLRIGDYVGMSDVAISCRKSITIGNHVTIGGDVVIIDSNAHCIDWKLRRKESKERKELDAAGYIKHASVKIEDDAFIGAHSIITKGVTIGARSVIAAGSVVVCDIPSDEIWGGNPAKFIKKLS